MDPQPSRVEKLNQAVRGLITLILVGCFCYGFIVKEIDSGLFATTVTMVVSFWFATRGGQNTPPNGAVAGPPSAVATATVEAPKTP